MASWQWGWHPQAARIWHLRLWSLARHNWEAKASCGKPPYVALKCSIDWFNSEVEFSDMQLSNWCSSGLLKSYRETKRNKKRTINATKHQVSCWSKITIGWPSSPRQLSLDRGLLDRSTGKRLVSLVIPKKGWQGTGRWLYLDVPAVKKMVKVNGTHGNGDRHLTLEVKPNFCFQGDIRNPGWLIHYVGNVSRLHVPNRQTPSENGPHVYNVLTAPTKFWLGRCVTRFSGLQICAALVIMFQRV